MIFTQTTQLILVGGALQGFLLAFLLLFRRTNLLANRVLGILILLMSVQSVLIVFDTQEFFIRFPQISKVSWLIPMFFGPLIYLFTRKLTARHPRFFPLDSIHFIPVVVVFFYLSPYFLKTGGEKIGYLSQLETTRQDDFGLIRQVTLFQVLFYLVYSLKALHQYKKKIYNTYSNHEKINLEWLKNFIYALLLIFILAVIALSVTKWFVPVLAELYHYYLHYLFVIVLVYAIGYKTLNQTQLFARFNSGSPILAPPSSMVPNNEESLVSSDSRELNDPGITALTEKQGKSGINREHSQRYLDQLLEYMETEKPYRQSNISIQELAGLLSMPRPYLLQIIQNFLDKNFYDFINQYRVAEAQTLLVAPENKHLTKLAIAKEAGFNSIAALEAVFKKQTGQTSSEYVQTYSQSNAEGTE